MSENNGNGSLEHDALHAYKSTVYEDASALVDVLESWDLTILPDDRRAEVTGLVARLRHSLGPAEPFEEPPYFDVWIIQMNDWGVTCKRCDNGIVVHGPTWVEGGTPEEGSRSTRTCTYCGEESYLVDLRPQWARAKSH